MIKHVLILIVIIVSISSHTLAQQVGPDSTKPKNEKIVDTNTSTHRLLDKFSPDRLKAKLIEPLSGLGFSKIRSMSAGNLGQFQKVSKLGANISEKLGTLYKHPFIFNGVTANVEGSYSGYMYDTTGFARFMNSTVSGNFTISGIPVNVDYRYSFLFDQGPFPTNGFSVDFKKDEYLSDIKKKLSKELNPELLTQEISAQLNGLKTKAINGLKSELEQLKSKYKDLIEQEIASLGNLESFVENGTSMLDDLSGSSGNFNLAYANLQTKIQTKLNTGIPLDSSETSALDGFKNKENAKREFFETVKRHYSKWEKSGVLESIRNLKKLKGEHLSDLLKNPSSLKKLATSKFSLNGIQKFFLNVENFKAGQNVRNSGQLSMNGFLNNGANLDFLKGNRYIAGVLGFQNQFTNVFDQNFTENVFNSNFRAIGASLGKGGLEGNHNHVNLTNYTQQETPGVGGFNPYMLTRNLSVSTFSKQMDVAGGILNVDVSRSASQYTNEINSDSSLITKSSIGSLLSGSNFLKSLAVAVDYSGELKGLDLQHRITARVTSDRYFNPGIQFVPAGTKEILADVKKSFLKRKMIVRVRTDFREYDLSAGTGSKFRNFSGLLDARWRMRKGRFLSLRYSPSRGMSTGLLRSGMKNNMDRLSAELNLNYRFKNFYYRNYLNLSYQRNDYKATNQPGLSNRTLSVSSVQQFTINRNIVYWNINYNHLSDQSQFIFFNSSTNSDIGMTYTIGDKITASSAINYNSIKGWYSQLGLRQNISGQIGNHIFLSIFLDAGKNLKIDQVLPYNNTFRTECSIQYQLD